MKDIIAKSIFILCDIAMIILSLYLAFLLRNSFNSLEIHTIPFLTYLTFYPIYIITISLFAYEGIYTYRYDFWHESRLIIKAILFATILVFAYLAMTKSIENYSRLVIGFAFIFMAFLIPLSKNISKKLLYRMKLWQKKAKIYANDPFLTAEIYGNPYLGYIEPKEGEFYSTIFVNSTKDNPQTLKHVLATQIKTQHEVIFIPLMDDYDLTHSHIYELSNTRTNLIVYKNRLKSKYRQWFQEFYNYLLGILLLPFLLLIIGIIAIFIKSESPGPIFYRHMRIGKKGRIIPIIKFRSMYQDAESRLKKLMQEDEAVQKEWKSNFKLKNDPRITKVGNFLRRTSLDELPQIFNVLRGDMHFVGPRPVLQEEIDQYYKEDAAYYYIVKPGITGLWQVSGRSDTDYDFRVSTDKWYVLNWSLWLDIVILFKTVRTVLRREGAY